MKIIDKFLTKKKINFFTLDEIENYQEGILILDSNFFHIIPMIFSKDIDKREREFEIIEKLENIFEDYDELYYLEKELSLKIENNLEKILFITIEKDKIYTLLDNLKEKNITLLGIYPLFLLELFNKNNIEKTYVEIEDEKYRLYYFLENKLVNFQESEFEKDELLSFPKYLEENLKGESFVYEAQKEIIKYFPNLKVKDWREYPLTLKTDFNFIPNEYILEENYKKNLKISTFIISLIIIISSILFFTLYFLRQTIDNKIYTYQENFSSIHEKNLKIRDEILKLEEEIRNIKKNSKVKYFNQIKLHKILTSISQNENLELTNFEYGDGIINLQGISNSEDAIYKFQNSILQNKLFKKFNHDYIKLKNDSYEFNIDIEVTNDILEEF
ncbi:Uncharacterised protein [Fusobacterium necrogenes]|uniref:Fimbrial assembly protein (PilN) n=1 Tax=Fusobacterium necrogenes TaxID=858 RepID=A0A377GV42_9FUSO|nr:hypothetical protein [Fusobacterium necrogenes]STO30703.1 Uncharacterised protein [Fusobacterium necrogenes]